MNKLLMLGIASGAMLVAGCAPVPLTKADVDGRVVCDRDLMDRVERSARRNATDIQWVHCPRVTLRVI
jgi:hypothetical protein